MPLARQLVDVPLMGGMDQKTDARLTAKPTQLFNAVMRKTGAIEKRYGSELLISRYVFDAPLQQPATPLDINTPLSPLSLAPYGNTLTLLSAQFLHQCGPGATHWTYVDNLPSVDVTRSSVAQLGSQAWSCSVATDGASQCFVWTDATSRTTTGPVYLCIQDAVTGEAIRAPYFLGNGRQSKVCALSDGTYVVTWIDAATANIRAVSVSGYSVGTPATIVTSGVKAGGSQMTAYELEACDSDYAIGFEESIGFLTLKRFTAAHAEINSQSVAGDVGYVAVALKWAPDNRLWWAALGTLGGDRLAEYGAVDASSFAVSVANTPIEKATLSTGPSFHSSAPNIGIEYLESGVCLVAYDTARTSTNTGISLVRCTTAGASGAIRRLNGGQSLVSKPWLDGGRVLFVAALTTQNIGAHTGADVPTDNFVVFESPALNTLYPTRPVGHYATGIGHYAPGYSCLSSAAASVVALPFASDASTGSTRTGLWACHVSPPSRNAVELGGALYLSGGVASVFDGTTVSEVGFLTPPTVDAVAAVSGVGGALAAGTYTYVLIWEGIDAAGRVHRSKPSAPVSVVASSGDAIDITVRQLAATTKQDELQSGAASSHWGFELHAVLYCLGTDLAYHRVGSLRNFPTAYSDTIQDAGNLSASALLSEPVLYTTGNVFEQVAPPGLRHIVAHQGRIVGVGDDGTVWFSNPVAAGEVASFCLEFRIPPFEGGDVTGLCSLDDKLVLFKRSSIWVVAGMGPTSTGAGEGFSVPQVISGDIGCAAARSLVAAPPGILFQSRSGIQLLTRGMAVQPVGKRVEDLTEAFPLCSAATHVPSQDQVRFELSDANNGTARLVYDYFHDAWSYDQVAQLESPVPEIVTGACLFDEEYAWATSGGTLYGETRDSWLDQGSFVNRIVTLGNIRVGAVDGFARFWRATATLYRYSSSGTLLTVDPARTGFALWSAADVDALAASQGSRVRVHVHADQQLQEYVTVSIADVVPADPTDYGTGRGLSITGITLEVGVRGTTTRRLAAGARK